MSYVLSNVLLEITRSEVILHDMGMASFVLEILDWATPVGCIRKVAAYFQTWDLDVCLALSFWGHALLVGANTACFCS